MPTGRAVDIYLAGAGQGEGGRAVASDAAEGRPAHPYRVHPRKGGASRPRPPLNLFPAVPRGKSRKVSHPPGTVAAVEAVRRVTAEPGERCTCGRPAVVVHVYGPRRVPWCGEELTPDEAARLEAELGG